MKYILALILALAIALTGCAGETVQEQAQPSPEQAQPQPTPLSSPEPAQAPGEDPGIPVNVGNALAMRPILHAIMVSIGLESDLSYDPHDPEIFWTILHSIGVSHGQIHPLVSADESGVTVPRQAMQEFASAAFLDYSDLLPVPDELEDIIRYDNGLDAYILTPTLPDDTFSMVEHYSDYGPATITLGLYNSDYRLGGMVFTLEDNPYLSAVTEPLFFYSVSSAQNEEELGLSRWQDVDPEAGAVLRSGEESVQVSIDYEEEEHRVTLTFAPGLTAGVAAVDIPVLHVADINPSDQYTELFVTADMGSEDYVTNIYRVVDGQLQEAVIGGSVHSFYGTEQLIASTFIDLLGTHRATFLITANQEELAFEPDKAYTLPVTPDRWEYAALTLSTSGLPMINMADGSQSEGNDGDRFLLAYTDGETYAVLLGEDGSSYQVEIAPAEPYGWNIAGRHESEWFEDLMYAG